MIPLEKLHPNVGSRTVSRVLGEDTEYKFLRAILGGEKIGKEGVCSVR